MPRQSLQRASLERRLAAAGPRLPATELRVARFLREHREEALVSSALALATKLGTSDATVIRAVQALGYGGMADLRKQLAAELREVRTLAARMARTLDDVGRAPEGVLERTLQEHLRALERLRRDVGAPLFEAALARITAAERVFVFGIGPSGAMADYFALQLARIGFETASLTATGALLADGLNRLRQGDVLIALAFGRVYRELAALLARAEAAHVVTLLITDALATVMQKRVDQVLRVERGRADALSLHTATLALIEALLVGVAARRPGETLASLKRLNALRAGLSCACSQKRSPT
jgi:DNA-binding MurR/RpiR family transcriptional regulator